MAPLGYDGGEIVRRGLADRTLVVSCDYFPRIEEVQSLLCDVMLEILGA